LKSQWVDLDIRDEVVEYITKLAETKIFTKTKLIRMIGVNRSRYYDWVSRSGISNKYCNNLPKMNWITPEEKVAILNYVNETFGNKTSFLKTGYRRIAYEMMDEDIAAVSPSSVYWILRDAGLLNKWDTMKMSSKGTGFKQPDKPHQEWHTDIKYVNVLGTFLFLITVMDGYSRYILHHELRFNMTQYDVELTVQKAVEKYPNESPKLISDNGPQYKARDFEKFLKETGLQHVKISVGYPQSNGKMERFYRTLNEECLKLKTVLDINDARNIIADYIDYYNKTRLHSALFYLTPEDFLMGRVEERISDRENKILEAKIYRGYYWSYLKQNYFLTNVF
jgi:transposase InsO family protein